MPTKDAHLALAERNQSTLDLLLDHPDKESLVEWIATVTFYAALHYVEAIFATTQKHSSTHDARLQELKSNQRYTSIYRHYRPLYSASMIARYLGDKQGSDFKCFVNYMSVDGNCLASSSVARRRRYWSAF